MVKSMPMARVDGAYQIAATYLKETGRLSAEVDIDDPLLETIIDDYRSEKEDETGACHSSNLAVRSNP